MFVVDPNPSFTHTVSARVPVNGGYDNQPFKVTFRVLDDEELATIDISKPKSAIAFLQQVVVGLDDIEGKDKQPIPYSESLRDQIVNIPYARNAMVKGYFEAVYQARLGN